MAAGLAARRTELVRARLAAEEKAALEAIKSDLCQWLVRRDVLALETAPENFLEALDSGVHLCKLVGLIQEAAARRERLGKDTLVRVPPTRLACKSIKAARGSPMYLANARDNAAKFIGWCRELGVEEAIIFESVGLVEHSDERRVILCLLDVARFAAKVGISPPELVALEKEIDEMEAQQESERDRDGERNQSEEEEEDKTASVEVRESEEEEDEEEETAEERVREYKDQEDEEEETVEEREKGRVREYKEEDEEEETVEEREKGRVREYKDQEEEEETVEEMEKEAVPGDEEPPEKRVKQVLSLAETGTVSPSANNPTRHRRSVPRGKRKKKETVDSRVNETLHSPDVFKLLLVWSR